MTTDAARCARREELQAMPFGRVLEIYAICPGSELATCRPDQLVDTILQKEFPPGQDSEVHTGLA